MRKSFASDLRHAAAPLARLLGALPSSSPLGSFGLGRTWALPEEDLDFHYAFKLIPTVQFCVGIYQSTLAATPLCFYTGQGDTKTEIERAPGNIVDLWARGNSEDTGLDLIEQIVGSMQLQGTAYLYKDFMGRSLPQQFWCLNPLLVRPIVAGNGRGVVEYEVRDGGSFVRVPRAQIVAFKRYDPDLKATGVSRVGALRLQYETQRDSARFMRAFYKRGGTIAGHYSTDQAIDPDAIDALKADLRERVQGPEHAWEPVILPRNLQFVKAGLTFAEMQFVDAAKITVEEMLRLFVIHPILAAQNVAAGLNGDTARTAMMMLLRFGIFPEARRIATTINERLLSTGEYGPDLSCEFDFSNDPVMVAAWLDMATAWEKATGGPIATRAEARDKLGLPDRTAEFPALDEPLVPVGMSTEADLAASQAAAVTAPGKPPVDPNLDPEADPAATGRQARPRRVSREALRVRSDRLLMLQERKVRAETVRILRRQQARVLAHMADEEAKLARAMGVRAVDVHAVAAQLEDTETRRRARRLIRAIVNDVGPQAIAELGLDLTYAMTAADVVAFIEAKAAAYISNINATTKAQLVESLAEGAAASETQNELVARVVEVFDGRRANAEAIARTETAAAYNFSTLSAWKQSGVVTKKQWLTAGDDAVRDAHQQADEQAVMIDEPFIVGGEQLDHPGAPGGSPGNIINCRCTMVPLTAANDEKQIPAPIRARLNGHVRTGLTVEEWLHAS